MINTFKEYIKMIFSIIKFNFLFSVLLMLLIALTEGVGLLILPQILKLLDLQVTESNFLNVQFTFISALIIFIGISVLNLFFQFSSFTCNSYIVNNFAHILRQDLYKSISNSNWLFLTKKKLSNLIQVITNDVDRIASGVQHFLQFSSSLIIAFIYVIFSLKISFVLTATAITTGVILSIILSKERKRIYKTGEELLDELKIFYNSLIEHFSGIKLTKSYNLVEINIKEFLKTSNNISSYYSKAFALQAKTKFLFDVSSLFALGILVFMANAFLKISTGSQLLLIYIFIRLIPRLSNIQNDFYYNINILPVFENLNKLRVECRQNKELLNNDREKIRITKNIQLSNISFGYKKDNLVLKKLSLSIEKKSFVAITGPSGCGKTTIADILTGLLLPQDGFILVDDVILTPEKIYSWREQIGYVSQDMFFFNDTIKNNLLRANPHANLKDINEALELSNSAFVFNLPLALETVIGDRGILLSGGERQRLALARALIRKPSLLILDEATSSLDLENEKIILDSLNKLRGKITILIISHRISTIKNSDFIYVIENGKAINNKSHEQTSFATL